MYADKWEGNAKSGWGGISPCHCRRWGRLLQHWQAPGRVDKKQFREGRKGQLKQGTCMTRSWHLLMNCDSVWTMVWRNLRYCTCLPWLSMQWTKCWTTFSFTSLHRTALSWKYTTFSRRHIMCWLDTWKIAHMVFAWSRSGFRNSSRCLWRST